MSERRKAEFALMTKTFNVWPRRGNDFLHSPAHDRASYQAPRITSRSRFRIRVAAVHAFLRAEEQAQRGGLRKRTKDPPPREGDRRIRPVRTGVQDPRGSEARLRRGPFAGDVRTAFRNR